MQQCKIARKCLILLNKLNTTGTSVKHLVKCIMSDIVIIEGLKYSRSHKIREDYVLESITFK